LHSNIPFAPTNFIVKTWQLEIKPQHWRNDHNQQAVDAHAVNLRYDTIGEFNVD